MLHAFAGGTQSKEQRLYEAAKANDLQKARQLLALSADPNGHVEHVERGVSSCLHAACQHKLSSKDIVALLLNAKADPSAEDEDGWRPLHWAASINAEDPIRLLLEHGADPNARTRRGETPLHWAAKNDAARAVRALAAHPQVDVLARCGRDQETPLEWARSFKSAAAEEALKGATSAAGAAGAAHVATQERRASKAPPWVMRLQ
jgi:ankyrin repeat protein|eukprot:Transcript_17780.p3 GENE.Transcript_17780~~Transcript_17780.p3  ORF type:complete len:205 (+),score=61.45 Transcript_17780:124-738(+)